MKTSHKTIRKLNKLILHTDLTKIVFLHKTEFGVVTKGKFEVYNCCVNRVIGRNECYILPSGHYYLKFSCGEDDCFESVNFHTEESPMTEICSHIYHYLFRPTNLITTPPPYLPDHPEQLPPKMSYACNNANNHSLNTLDDRQYKMTARLILSALLSISTDEMPSLSFTCYSDEVLEFDNLIHSNLLRRVTIGDLAEQSGRSHSDFKRTFGRIFGDTPHHWFVTKRLELAGIMLIFTSYTVKVIAHSCCFSSASHFIRIFSREYGCSPTIFRKKYCKTTHRANTTLTKYGRGKLNNFNNGG